MFFFYYLIQTGASKDQSNHHSFSPLISPSSLPPSLPPQPPPNFPALLYILSRAEHPDGKPALLVQECLVTVEEGFTRTTSHFKDTLALKCRVQS